MRILFKNRQWHNLIEQIKFERHPDIQQAYDEHLIKLKQQCITPEQAVMLYAEQFQVTKCQHAIITPNQFPYIIPENCKHIIIWGELTDEETKTLCFITFKMNKTVLVFENDYRKKSVKDIKHKHAIIKV